MSSEALGKKNMRDTNKNDGIVRGETKDSPSGEESYMQKTTLHDEQKFEVSENIMEKQKLPAPPKFGEDNNDCDRKILELEEPTTCVNEIFTPERENTKLNAPCAQAEKLFDKLLTTTGGETAKQGCFEQEEDIKVHSASEIHPGQNKNDFMAIPVKEYGLMSMNGAHTSGVIHDTRMSSKCDEIMPMQSHIAVPQDENSLFSEASGIQGRNTMKSCHPSLLLTENTSKTLFQCGAFNPNSDLIGRGSPVSNLSSLKPSGLSNSQIESKDPLETLANAALSDHASINRKIKEESIPKEPGWCDVGIFKGNSCHVTSYYAPSTRDPDHDNITSDNLPDFSNALKIDLESGTAYKFRICAVNSCGRGPWSEVSAFRTSLPGYPGAPSSVAISRSAEGAHLSWQPPSNPAGTIIEYTVCLAVKNPTQAHSVHIGQKLTLIKVYTGPHTQTIVSNACLAEAHIDTSSKPAIIFRIAARNEKGFGPPTQVRWLQDVVDPHTTGVKI